MNTSTHYDAIIVGAGPAGSSAAALLASAGMRVALLEQAVFPRDKLCGGLLTLRTRNLFEQIFSAPWEPAIDVQTDGLSMYHGATLLNTVAHYLPLYLASRRVFDHYLAALAEQRGAALLQRTRVQSVDASTMTVSLENGGELHADFIIGADGVFSRVARSLFAHPFHIPRLSIGVEVEVPHRDLLRTVPHPEIYFGVCRWGYGWVFPRSQTHVIGLGGIAKYNPDIVSNCTAFLREVCHISRHLPIRGHYIPSGTYRKQPGRQAILLVGDAAGLTEPITSEGIAFAMQSGTFAAEAILAAAQQNHPAYAYRLYYPKYRQITAMFDYANLMKYLIFPAFSQRRFIKVITQSNLPIFRHIDLLADHISYPAYWRFILKKVVKYLLR